MKKSEVSFGVSNLTRSSRRETILVLQPYTDSAEFIIAHSKVSYNPLDLHASYHTTLHYLGSFSHPT